MKIINEQDALQPLINKARMTIPTPDGLIPRIRNGVIPAVKGMLKSLGEDCKVAMVVSEEHCWFFGDRLWIRAAPRASHEGSELTCYAPSRDFGKITIERAEGTLKIKIDGLLGNPAIELAASGWDLAGLEAAIPYLFGRGEGLVETPPTHQA